jgi:hypothetical protein
MTLFLWLQPKIKIGGNNATEYCGTHRAVVAVVGTLGGAVIGQRMTRDSQHKQWLRDKKSEKYSELLDALTAAGYQPLTAIRS